MTSGERSTTVWRAAAKLATDATWQESSLRSRAIRTAEQRAADEYGVVARTDVGVIAEQSTGTNGRSLRGLEKWTARPILVSSRNNVPPFATSRRPCLDCIEPGAEFLNPERLCDVVAGADARGFYRRIDGPDC